MHGIGKELHRKSKLGMVKYGNEELNNSINK
jgi:hypothetical protein